MAAPHHPLWIIGLDGLEPDLLARWSAEGHLPTLSACMARGRHGRLLSTPNQLTSSAWMTVATGCSPATHGVYNFQERVPGEYRLRLPTAADRSLPAFWETASDAGCTVITARVPMSYPVRPVHGLQVADWLAPSPNSPGFAYPESLARDLRRRFDHAFWLEPTDLLNSARYYRVLQALLHNADRTFELFDYLLSRERADLFFGVVREADVAGHIFWGFHAGTKSCHDPYLTRDLQEALRQVYERIDQRLGEMLARMPSGGNLLIVSDHGMGSRPHGPDYVGPLLEQAGLMVRHPAPTAPPRRWPQVREAACRHIPWSLRRRLKPLDADTWSRGFTQSHLAHIDFARSRAFSYLYSTMGEVWLNLQGRDPQGVVAPGREQRELEDALADMFAGCEEMATGRPLVESVWRRDELFAGPHRDIFADLHVRFDPDLPAHGARARFGGRELAVPPFPAPQGPAGFHRPYGVFVACGPDITGAPQPVAGALDDVAPTALALLGLPVPCFMEGRVLNEALTDSMDRQYADLPVSRAASAVPEPAYSAADLTRIEGRLAELGYL